MDAEPGDLVFESSQNRKPRICGSDLRFNVSHSVDLEVISIARGREVGIDVERLSRRSTSARAMPGASPARGGPFELLQIPV